MDRYLTQISLDDIDKTGQEKLKNSSVLVIGAGGLGCPVLQYLTRVGIGRIGVMDGDIVSLANLHRQTLYTENDITKSKVNAACDYLRKVNSSLKLIPYDYFLTKENAKSIIENYDLILDCTDSIEVRYQINDTCVLLNKTFIYGALHQYEGQVSVFNYKNSGTYRCLFPEKQIDADTISCTDGGVMPTLAGIVGLFQANETIKVLLDLNNILSNELLVFDTRNYALRKLKYSRTTSAEIKVEKSIHDANLEILPKSKISDIISLEISEMSSDHFLIDIRSQEEAENSPIPNALALDPLEVEGFIRNMKTKRKVVLICQHGTRSLHLAKRIRKNGTPYIQSLKGGIRNFEFTKKVTL